MRLKICAVSDRAVGAFMRPIFAPSSGAAIRSFTDEVNRGGSEMNKHPEDYELHYFGEFDEVSGKFDIHEAQVLVRAKDVVQVPGNAPWPNETA